MTDTVIGIHATTALLRRDPGRVRELILQRGRRDRRFSELRSLAEGAGIRVVERQRPELDQMVRATHQGVIARVEPAKLRDERHLQRLLDDLDEPALLLVLDGVTDPHNLGACLRSAEAAGVHAVILPRDRSAGLSPVVRKVACGAAELLPMIAVTNLARCLRALKQRGIWLLGTCADAERTIHEIDCSGSLALILGAEGSGMRRLTRECCDFLARIPMRGSVTSLNVSVAAGVCLFEALRQRSRE